MQKTLLLPLTTIFMWVFIENCARAADVSDWAGLRSNDETLVLTGDIDVPSSNSSNDMIYKKNITQTIDGADFAIDGTNVSSAYSQIHIQDGADLTFNNLTVQNFSGTRLFGTYSANDTANLTINNSIFKDNITTGTGGPINFKGKGTLTLNNTIFNNNSNTSHDAGALYVSAGTLNMTGGGFYNSKSLKSTGGAISLGGDATVKMQNVVFDTNTAQTKGGAIHAGLSNNSIELNGTIFTNNSAMGSWGTGGAIHLTETNTLSVKNSTFSKNFVTTSISQGGAIYVNGTSTKSSALTVDNTEFNGNYAESGGAIAMAENTTLTVTNSKFSNNEAKGRYGGAVYTDGAQSNIIDTNFTENSAEKGGALYFLAEDSRVFADTQDVKFSGNIANRDNFEDLENSYNGGGAIYLDSTYDNVVTLSLNASNDKKIIIDDTVGAYVKGTHKNVIDINKSGLTYTNQDGETVDMGNTGEVQFNHFVGDGSGNAFTINLYGGTLSIGQNAETNAKFLNADGYIDFDKFYVLGDSILNTANNKIGAFVPYEFVIGDGVNLSYRFDVDLAGAQSDRLVGAKNNGTLNISLADLNILSDATDDEITVSYSETNVGGVLHGETLTTSGATYTASAVNDDAGSRLVFTKTGDIVACDAGLAVAIKNKSDVFAITSGTDEVIDKWLTNKVENNLTINANGHGITAASDDLFGMVVAENNALTINNATDISGFNNALVTERNATLTINDSNLTGNMGDATITNHGTLNINAINSDVLIAQGDAALAISVAPDTQVNIGGNRTVVIDGEITGGNGGRVNIATDTKVTGLVEFVTIAQSAGTVSIADIRNAGYELTGGTLDLTSGKYAATSTLLGGGNINMANSTADNLTLGNVKLAGRTDLSVDANLSTATMDTILADALDYQGGAINVHRINLAGRTNQPSVTMAFADEVLKDHVTTDITSVMGDIYRYSVDYDADTGDFTFSSTGNDYQDFNPAVMSGAVAAQLGGYLNQLQSYDEAFHNLDMYPYMLISRDQRQSIQRRNKYNAAYLNLTYDEDAAYRDSGARIRPYASLGRVKLKNGPRVKQTTYGSYAGLESRMGYLGNGWDGLLSGYVGYNGSSQKFDGINLRQNGGTAGVVGMAYKNNFFAGLTINAGANYVQENTMYGDDSFSMMTMGVATKTGYNLEYSDGRFIAQPSLLMSYSMVNVPDYTNVADVKIKSDPLHAIQFEPGLRLMGSFDNGWLPYSNISMVWSIMDKTDFQANDAALPELSVKPFAKYGIGVRKTWDDRLTGFVQCDLTGGGKNSVGFQAGFRWTIGK